MHSLVLRRARAYQPPLIGRRVPVRGARSPRFETVLAYWPEPSVTYSPLPIPMSAKLRMLSVPALKYSL